MKAKCEQCKTSFEAKRKNQKYCSDNCKQQAYYARAANKLAEAEKTIPDREKDSGLIFYMSEYLHIQRRHSSDCGEEGSDLDLVTFSFLRKNYIKSKIDSSEGLKDLEDYMFGFCVNSRYSFEMVRKTKVFDEFKEKFLNGDYQVI